MVAASANAQTLDLKLPLASGKTTEVPELKIYEDSAEGLWVRTYNPLSHDAATDLNALVEAGKLRLEVEAMPEEDFRATEMTWLQANQEELNRRYPGEWLAIDGPALVAHAGNLAQLLQISQAAGHPHPFITAIPTEPFAHLHM